MFAKDVEPKLKSSIVVRPAYTSKMQVYESHESVRHIGQLYVNGNSIYTSSDKDTESSAFVAVAKHIQWYQNKYDSNIFIDASMNKLKNK